MAAPNSEFITKTIGHLDGSTTKSARVGTYDAAVAVLKTRYYLDFVRGVAEYNSAGAEVAAGTGFIGGCIVGSNNYAMHNTNRHWSVAGFTASNEVLFNDAGKNTLGIAILNNTGRLLWANNVRFNITYRSSWHNDTTQIGIRMRVGTGAWVTRVWHGETIARRNQITSNRLFDTNLNKGQNVQFQVFLVNEEGPFYAISQSFLLDDKIYQMDAIFRTQACLTTGEGQRAIWIKESDLAALPTVTTTGSATGIFFWKNVDATIKADAGWYMGMDNDKSFNVDSGGQVTRYQDCPVAPPELSLFVESDSSGKMQIFASLDAAVAYNVTVTGRIDTDPTNATPNGASFSISIPQGQTGGTDPNFSLARISGATYYWQSYATVPAGILIIRQEPI